MAIDRRGIYAVLRNRQTAVAQRNAGAVPATEGAPVPEGQIQPLPLEARRTAAAPGRRRAECFAARVTPGGDNLRFSAQGESGAGAGSARRGPRPPPRLRLKPPPVNPYEIPPQAGAAVEPAPPVQPEPPAQAPPPADSTSAPPPAGRGAVCTAQRNAERAAAHARVGRTPACLRDARRRAAHATAGIGCQKYRRSQIPKQLKSAARFPASARSRRRTALLPAEPTAKR